MSYNKIENEITIQSAIESKEKTASLIESSEKFYINERLVTIKKAIDGSIKSRRYFIFIEDEDLYEGTYCGSIKVIEYLKKLGYTIEPIKSTIAKFNSNVKSVGIKISWD